MANSVIVPQDIIDNIIEAVDDNHDLLKNCALVSSSFLLPSRRRLFSKIFLRRDDQACKRLYQVLDENPVIQSFVRSIAITGYEPFESHSLIDILRLPFCCLESFSINIPRYASDWNDLSGELKDALSAVIHLSTLKTLYLEGVVKVPIMLFRGIHLTKLEFSSWVLKDFYGHKAMLLTSEASEGAMSATVIDHCAWNFYRPVHGRTEPILLPFMCRLRVFEIRADPFSAIMSDFAILSLLMRSLRISLTSPATLEHIKFHIVFHENAYDFNHSAFFGDLRDADVWRHLDSIITHPTGSRLQRVDINIQYCFLYEDNGSEPDKAEVMRPVLDALPLLREKGILFVEAYRSVDIHS